MNANDMFPSKYLKASDLGDHKPVVVISNIELENLGSEEAPDKKPVLYFKGKDKGLACNKTNWNTLISLYGQETDGWIGKAIKLQSMEVQFKGRMTMAIRISLNKPSSPGVSENPRTKMVDSSPLENEEIPF